MRYTSSERKRELRAAIGTQPMIKRLLLLFLFAIPAFGQTVNIPIQNSSFEASVNLGSPGSCGKGFWGPIPNWQGVQQSGGSFGVVQWTCSTPPDGLQVAFVGNATISQDTGVKASDIQANAGPTRSGSYVMRFFVADQSPPYPGYFEAKISLGTTDTQGVIHIAHELCSTDGPSLATWQEVAFTCLSPGHIIYDKWPDGSAVDLNAHIIISLSATWWEVLFDKVSLAFTPTN